MKNKNVAFMTQAAMIAAIYVVLTYVFAPFSFGEVQIRIAEALTILPVFTPAAIPGLFVGCIVGNILGGAILPDIIFGSIATLIGAFFTYQLPRPLQNQSLPTLPCEQDFFGFPPHHQQQQLYISYFSLFHLLSNFHLVTISLFIL